MESIQGPIVAFICLCRLFEIDVQLTFLFLSACHIRFHIDESDYNDNLSLIKVWIEENIVNLGHSVCTPFRKWM